MYCLSQFCRICINKHKALTNLYTPDKDLITFYDKLKYFNTNLMSDKTNLLSFICKSCCSKLQKSYQFVKLCLKSENVLRGYIEKLENASTFDKEEPGKLADLLDENQEELNILICDTSGNKEFRTDLGIEMIKIEPPSNTDMEYCSETEDYDMSDENEESEESSNPTIMGPATLEPIVPNAPKSTTPPVIISRVMPDKLLPCVASTVTKQGLEIIKLGPAFKSENVEEIKEVLDNLKEMEKNPSGIEIIKENQNQPTSSSAVTKENPVTPTVPRDKPVSTGKTYHCDVCNKKFSQLCHLKNHVLIHTGAKPYECEICFKRFNQSSVLKRHLMIHSGDRPHACQLCGKKFTHLGNLKKHIQTHTDDKRYECEICLKKFNLQCYLRKHKMTHTDVRRYECEECGKRFIESGNLKAHLIKHSTAKPYKCEHCPKAFKHLVSLTAHRNTHVVVIKQ